MGLSRCFHLCLKLRGSMRRGCQAPTCPYKSVAWLSLSPCGQAFPLASSSRSTLFLSLFPTQERVLEGWATRAMPHVRRLPAILAADAACYSHLRAW
jgi:hypothetical protein